MKRIIIDYPDDCTEQEAMMYATGCFNQHQNDYKSYKEGYYNGSALCFGDNRKGYLYKTNHGNYVLKLERKDEK